MLMAAAIFAATWRLFSPLLPLPLLIFYFAAAAAAFADCHIFAIIFSFLSMPLPP